MIKALTTGPFTGRHFAAIIVVFFAVVIAVNVYMARAAISTFGGEVVENSYVASQHYNTWLAEAKREQALGWRATPSHRPDGRVVVTLAGPRAGEVSLKADARHPLGRIPDQFLTFHRQADGSFLSDQVLPPERWDLHIEARAAGQIWRTEQDFR